MGKSQNLLLASRYHPSMRKFRPLWKSIVDSNSREKERLRAELAGMRGALQLLMKPRNGVRWTAPETAQLRAALVSASRVSPYLVVLALPGSVLLLPLLAWRLDVRRKGRS